MGKIRVLHVFPSRSWGGAEIQMLEIAKWTRDLGVEPTIWCADGSPIFKEASRLGMSTVTTPLSLKGIIPPLWKIVPILKRGRYDVVHLHWAAGMRLFYPVKFFIKVKLIFYHHMWVTLTKKDLFHKLAYSAIDAMTVSGERGQAALLKHLPVRNDQIVICPYGVDKEKIDESILNHQGVNLDERKRWGIPAQAFVLGFFGRIDRQKGVKEFVETAQAILSTDPNIHYLIVGDPTLNEADATLYKEEVFNIIDQCTEKDRIHHIGHQSNFHSPMACCDLIVIPSYMECYSILILHAFALGLPVVSTNAGGTPDLIGAPQRGWLVEPKSTTSLLATLLEICRNPSEIKKKSQPCRDYVWKHHSSEYVGSRFFRIYEAVTKGAPLDF
jgi:glycosyltransferase involved in cell wall biosynthesis